MNRIDEAFRRLRQQGRKGLIAYLGAGDPSLDATARLARQFERAGVDLLELGVPFSDPLADGPVNQLAAQRALEAGVTPRAVMEMVAQLRADGVRMPIVFYLYYNLIHRWGREQFVADAIRAGVDGVLPLDLPPEEKADALGPGVALHTIRLIAPTTPPQRIARICRSARGFIYYVSREGVTGMQNTIPSSIGERVALIRQHTRLPVAVGFGISNGEQARAVAAHADAVVVGSAIVNRIGQLGNTEQMYREVTDFIESLARAVHQ